MNKINILNWKDYKIKELFGHAKLGKYHDPKSLILSETGFPYICASNQNNGISKDMPRVTGENILPTPKHIICWGKQCPLFTYHKEECITAQGMYYLELPEEITENTALFICTLLKKKCEEKFNYKNCLIGSKMDEITIKLPTMNGQTPDWQYMEEYMKNVESEVTSKIDKFQRILGNENHKIDTQKWGGYRIGDLFEIKISKSVNKTDLNFTCDGKYDFIGRTSINNGVQGRMEQMKIPPNSKQTFSVAQIGENVCLYRDNEWYSSQNIFCLTPKYIELIQCNKFITSVITKQLKATFGLDAYSNYPTLKTLSTLIIKLPTQDGKPDWDYMENYINNIKCKVCQNISSMEGVDANG